MTNREIEEMLLPSTKMEKALANKGVIINRHGYIFRLSVSPAGKARISQNRYDKSNNTVIGPAIYVEEFHTAEEAIERFEQYKKMIGNTWREDERVMYEP